jgi:hypothetical protein
MALNPRESGEFIVKNAKYLEVVELGIKNVANQVSFREFKINFTKLFFRAFNSIKMNQK